MTLKDDMGMGSMVGLPVREFCDHGVVRTRDKQNHSFAIHVDRKQGISAVAFHRRLNRRSACLPLLLGRHHVV